MRLFLVLLLGASAAHADAKLALGTPRGTGAFDGVGVAAAMTRSQDALRRCFEVSSSATVTFLIDAEGRVADVTTAGVDPKAAACLTATVRSLELARPLDGVPILVACPLEFVRTKPPAPQLPAPWSSTLVTGFYVPSASVGWPTVHGALDATVVRRTVGRRLAELSYCYERELLGHGVRSGRVVVELTIAARPDRNAGRVTAIQATGVDAAVETCVADTLRAISFPAPRGGDATVRLPIGFRSAGFDAGFSAPLKTAIRVHPARPARRSLHQDALSRARPARDVHASALNWMYVSDSHGDRGRDRRAPAGAPPAARESGGR